MLPALFSCSLKLFIRTGIIHFSIFLHDLKSIHCCCQFQFGGICCQERWIIDKGPKPCSWMGNWHWNYFGGCVSRVEELWWRVPLLATNEHYPHDWPICSNSDTCNFDSNTHRGCRGCRIQVSMGFTSN